MFLKRMYVLILSPGFKSLDIRFWEAGANHLYDLNPGEMNFYYIVSLEFYSYS